MTKQHTRFIVMSVLLSSLLFVWQTAAYGQTESSSNSARFGTDTSNQDLLIWNAGDVRDSIISNLYSYRVTDLQLFEDGRAILTLVGDENSPAVNQTVVIQYHHDITPQFGFTYADNGTIIAPDGRQVRIAFDE